MTVMMKPPKMRRDERKERKNERRRNKGTRQSAHYRVGGIVGDVSVPAPLY
ncbi:hypothetical protein [Actinomyces oris]|uniref:hypothetical protein n=1 Tax=Actinomyces oris TaxID=544580 RepID=UPI000AE57A5F|nr:hypothetical protein [Actinomyces oris]